MDYLLAIIVGLILLGIFAGGAKKTMENDSRATRRSIKRAKQSDPKPKK